METFGWANFCLLCPPCTALDHASSLSRKLAYVPGPTFGFVKLLASSGSHCTKWADEQHRQAGFESRLVPDLPLSLYPHFNRPSGFWPCVKSCLVGGKKLGKSARVVGLVGQLVFYGISTLVDYLMPIPVYIYKYIYDLQAKLTLFFIELLQ